MNVIDLSRKLIQCQSVTPDDAGAQKLIAKLLEKKGFSVEWLNKDGVTNLYAYYGDKNPALLLAGHTDVVPAGNESDWRHAPFSATEEGGFIWGRGAADMKSGVAALVTACLQSIEENPKINVALILTSDEEGVAESGTRYIVQWMEKNKIAPKWCLLAEPSSELKIADTVRVGRRGSLTAEILIKGKQGHIAYPELADNPIDKIAKIITAMREANWDDGYADFPDTSCQFSNIRAGVGATNVIPGDAHLQCNFRFNPASTPQSLKEITHTIIQKHAKDFEIKWILSGNPFYANDREFVTKVSEIINEELGYIPKASTGGGTSDGRFIATLGTSVIELGVSNKTIHQIDECVAIDEITVAEKLYKKIILAFTT